MSISARQISPTRDHTVRHRPDPILTVALMIYGLISLWMMFVGTLFIVRAGFI